MDQVHGLWLGFKGLEDFGQAPFRNRLRCLVGKHANDAGACKGSVLPVLRSPTPPTVNGGTEPSSSLGEPP